MLKTPAQIDAGDKKSQALSITAFHYSLIMLNPTELRAGTVITLENAPCLVIKYEHNKMGRGGATVRVKVKNLKSGAIFEKTFRGNEKADEADVTKGMASYLYNNGTEYTFMDLNTYNQFALSKQELGDQTKWLKEGMELNYMAYESKPISISVPIKMEFEVISTEPGVKGNTVSNVLKPATIETGVQVAVPLFIKTGDKICVNTEEGVYVERV